MENLISEVKNSKRKKFFFWEENIFSYGERLDSESLDKIEKSFGLTFPLKIRKLLLELGQGFANDLYIHGADMIYPFDEKNGKIEGFVAFASDDLGNYYAFSPKSNDSEAIYYCCHDPLGYCIVAKDAEDFLNIFISSGFKITDYVYNLELECS